MPNIKLHTSNKMSVLADKLARVVEEPLGSLFKPEIIVVQSKGMERWISMQLAERLGIWANCNYYFPNKIIEEIYKCIIPEAEQGRIFNKEVIVWEIMTLLPQCLGLEGFESLNDYLKNDESGLRLFQLSSRITDTFDQYLTFRPELILEWDKRNGDTWQAKLWRELMKNKTSLHPPALKEVFSQRINESTILNLNYLPERISIFGISSMPLYHLDVLAAISDYIEVNFFFLNPCMEYWSDIRPEKKIAATLGAYDDKSGVSELHLEKGNSLLASMGKQGGEFLHNIMKYSYVQEFSDFIDTGKDSLLHYVQSDILNMTDRGSPVLADRLGTVEAIDPVELSLNQFKSDNSIRIHSCHSPLRETEVLYDNLLNFFNSEQIEPGEIIVMTPDIELYSPYIKAVFGEAESEEKKIPYSIADTSIRKNTLIDTFFTVLDLEQGRFESGAVVDLLERSEIMNRFDISINDAGIIRRWVMDTRINWGIDAADRMQKGLPGFKENTWKAGIERLLLGYAMPGNEDLLYEDILPYDVEGNDSVILGKFIEYFKTMSGIVKLLSGTYTLNEWASVLIKIQKDLFGENDSDSNLILTESIKTIEELESLSGFNSKIDLKVIKEFLENSLNEKRIQSGFLTGSVTFCALLPMRSIPFEIICMIGMNDDAFPSTERAVGFNYIQQEPRPGDRSKRNDDRYLFLESLMSARKKLYISYVGQSIQDNSEITPSVLVSELLDYIDQAYFIKDNNIRNYIHIKHPLQSFSSRYFKGDDNIFSYSEAICRAGRVAVSERKEPDPFIQGKLSETYDAGDQVNLHDLIRFFTYPAKHLLTTRLGLYLDGRVDILNEAEPFEQKELDSYSLEKTLCEHLINGNEAQELYKIFRAKGMLLHGRAGEIAFNKLIPGAVSFSQKVRDTIGEEVPVSLEINTDISGCRLSGFLDNVRPSGMTNYRYADTKARDRLKAWIAHLALNASGADTFALKSKLICKDATWEMEPVSSKQMLKELMEIYLKGMNELIHFFPAASMEYAQEMVLSGNHEKALRAANKKWTGNDYQTGEGSYDYNYLCFKNMDPLDKGFTEMSLRILKPMLELQKKSES
ncbi:MAG: exodeoxyribonuclease V subunit gamma [Spirochaetes bacterium]|nr:exodeoxyribonuclease V subunit gamma [Spirochaetota bacterium]